MRDLRKAGEFWLFVYVLLSVLLLKEVLQIKMNTNSHSRPIQDVVGTHLSACCCRHRRETTAKSLDVTFCKKYTFEI